MGKKYPVLTGSICDTMEKLRLAIEVLTGKRTCFVCLDFNTHNCSVRVGDEIFKLLFINGENLIQFELNNSDWNLATFSDDFKEVKVANRLTPNVRQTVAGNFSMRWVGCSATERREEPLFLEEAEHCAKVRGLTLENLLN
jgi:hypothetical protein